MTITPRSWVPEPCEARVQDIAAQTAQTPSAQLLTRIQDLAAQNRAIHEPECFNLNPVTNVMNHAAETVCASRIGSRPPFRPPGPQTSLGL